MASRRGFLVLAFLAAGSIALCRSSARAWPWETAAGATWQQQQQQHKWAWSEHGGSSELSSSARTDGSAYSRVTRVLAGTGKGETRVSGAQAGALRGETRVDRRLARTLIFTKIVVWNQNNYRNAPNTLLPGGIAFPVKGPACQRIPTAFQRNVKSIRIFFQIVSAKGASLKACSKVTFFTQPSCTGFSLQFTKPKKGSRRSYVAYFPPSYSTQVVSVQCT